MQLCCGPGDETVVSGGYDQAVRVWDVRSRAFDPVQTLKPFADSVTAVLVTQRCAPSIASAGAQPIILMLLCVPQQLQSHSVSCRLGRKTHLHRNGADEKQADCGTSKCPGSGRAVHADAARARRAEIVAASVDGTVRCFDVRAGCQTTDALGTPVSAAALSHDGNCVLAACLDSRLRLLDRGSGTLLAQYTGAPCCGKRCIAGSR